jgi:hypothetical protein
MGARRRRLVLGDLNDGPGAATTQLLYGSPGSQIGTGGFDHPDQGDRQRLWNLAARIPEAQRFSRKFEGRRELIDHILVSHALVGLVADGGVTTDSAGPTPSITADRPPAATRPDQTTGRCLPSLPCSPARGAHRAENRRIRASGGTVSEPQVGGRVASKAVQAIAIRNSMAALGVDEGRFERRLPHLSTPRPVQFRVPSTASPHTSSPVMIVGQARRQVRPHWPGF